ncbi:MAG: hypothetical protein QXX94_03020 [Candidatus Bathyarchaeia archaeon]
MQRRIYIPILLSILALPILTSHLAASINPSLDNIEAEKAEKILWIANTARRRVEILINLTIINETIIGKIKDAGLEEEWNGNLSLFNEGVELLENAASFFNEEDYLNATTYAMQAMEIFRNVFRNINRILCQANVRKEELIDGRGLLEAINRALARIEKIKNLLVSLEEKGIEVSEVLEILEEAESYLNVTEAIKLLQQGNVSAVSEGMLAQANKLITQALRKLKEKIRESVTERIEQFKRKLERLRERIRERLREMNITEDEFYQHWNFTAKGFWGKHIEILEKVRERLREGINATDLKILGTRMREICLELEMRLRKHEGKEAINITVNVEKIMESKIGRKVTVLLRVTVKNDGNVTVIFPNPAFGIIVEKKVNDRWEFYSSPFSTQSLTFLKPGEIGEVRMRLRAAEPGNYRVRVHAWSREGLVAIESSEFTLP